MTTRFVLLEIVLLSFAAFTGYAVAQHGVLGFHELVFLPLLSNAWGVQLMIDFVIAQTLILFWVVDDARKRGLAWWPYVLLTLTLGSIGPLTYLVRREWQNVRLPLRARRQHA